MSLAFSVTISVMTTEIPGLAEFEVTSDCPFDLEPADLVEILQSSAQYIKDHPEEYRS